MKVSGSAGCGWWRLWGAVLQDVITMMVSVQGLCSPEDGLNDARNMLRQKVIINI